MAKAKAKPTGTAVAKVHKTGTAVAIRQDGNTPASATATMVALAQSKDFDAVKFQALAQFQKDMVAQQAHINFVEDFHAMQARMIEITAANKIVIKDKSTGKEIQSTPYASFPDIMKVVKPILQFHNFGLNFTIDVQTEGRVTVTGVLANLRGGETQTSTMTLPLDNTGSKNNVQGYGSAVSYAKRYITIGLLNITSRAPIDQDDDGKIAGDARSAFINADQCKTLEKKIKATGAALPRFLEFFGIDEVRNLPVGRYKEAMGLLEQKEKKAAAG